MDDLRYPIGDFSIPESSTREQRVQWIRDIAAAPAAMRTAVEGLAEVQLDTPYRPGGWTVRQVVHHVPESHMNAYVRFKLALTEERPMVKPYDEALWAKLPDCVAAPLGMSLNLLDALHVRWVRALESMADAEFQRSFLHPESGPWRLDQYLAQYSWHSRHHTAHIASLRDRMGWN